MSWKKVPRPAGAKRSYRLWVIIGVLVAFNVGVVLYHGDPRTKSQKNTVHGEAKPGKSRPRAALTRGASAAQHLAGWLLNTAVAAPGPTLLPGFDAFDDLEGPPAPAPPLPLPAAAALQVRRVTLRARQTPAAALLSAGVAGDEINAAFASLAPWVNFRRMRPGTELVAKLDDKGRLNALDVTHGLLDQARARRTPQGFVSEKVEVMLDTVVAEVQGEVRSSLWDALVAAGESPALVQTLVDIFAYEIDFYTEMRQGDTFRLLVEKRYANGQFLDYGAVSAAEFTCGNTPHRAFAHQNQDGRISYYDADGRALRKQLLKAPLQYGAVTSRFGVRRHPILGYTRNHNGTDYGVPVGTPVWSVGDGRVIKAGWHGGFGRLVEVSHPNGWVSQYAHLSRISVHVGARVHQKQVVGMVGQTGLATGPHLHYGLKKNGYYVNSLVQSFERALPLAGEALTQYHTQVAKLLSDLDKMRLAQQQAMLTPVTVVPSKG